MKSDKVSVHTCHLAGIVTLVVKQEVIGVLYCLVLNYAPLRSCMCSLKEAEIS